MNLSLFKFGDGDRWGFSLLGFIYDGAKPVWFDFSVVELHTYDWTRSLFSVGWDHNGLRLDFLFMHVS